MTLKVNGENLLTFEYYDGVRLETIRTGQDELVMSVLYNEAGQPVYIASNRYDAYNTSPTCYLKR